MKITVVSEHQLFLIILLLISTQLCALIRLPGIISSNMVIQRNKPFTIWGWADPGESIAIRTSWSENVYTAVADPDKRWTITLDTPWVGGPYSIDIQGDNKITLENMLCGDIWFCAGQSNMEMGMKLVENSLSEIKAAHYPDIRLYDVQKAESDTILEDVNGHWKPCLPETVSEGDWEGFSAVAYYFGRQVYRELGIPIGLVDISWSATAIEPWISPEGYQAVSQIADMYINRNQLPRQGVWGQPDRPSRIYNAMLAPLQSLTFCGVLWYQGESNVGDGADYYYKMKALITGWREVWKQGLFPFYFVQIAPYREYDRDKLIKMWDAQKKVLEIPNTAMVRTEDIGDWNDIHPKNKKDVGERLARIALSEYYEQ